MSLIVTFLLEKFTKIQASIDQASSDEDREAAKLAMKGFLEDQKKYLEDYTITLPTIWQKWFISIQTRAELEVPVLTATAAVGIDLGITQFTAMSNGNFISPLNSFKKHAARLSNYQRKMSRKVRFSNNWKKAKNKVQKIHTQIANMSKDFLHKITTNSIEDLQIRKISKSAAGTSVEPERMTKKKNRLNRCILDQGWGIFPSQLEYKLKWSGGVLIAVPPYHTSQTCPDFHHVSADNRKIQAFFKCVISTYENNADVVGAINILERGYRLLAFGESAKLRHSLKQEPTEVSQLAFN